MVRSELLEASDGVIDDAVTYADPLVLRGLLYQLIGDARIAAIPTTMVPMGFREDAPGIVDADDIAFLRAQAAAFLKSYRDRGAGDCALGPADRLRRSMDLTVGSAIPDAELPMWMEQLALQPTARGLDWRRKPTDAQSSEFLVAVIGAGMAGLNAAIRLKQAGIPYVVLEKNGGVGGTWHENRYPGARVDSTSRTYFHGYGVDFPCSSAFCPQAVNERYFNWMADNFEVRDDIVFHTEVRSIIWDEEAGLWEIRAHSKEGERVWRANAVISGVGFLSRANLPVIDGADSFTGLKFHTSRWPDKLDLSGKRVAVIGSGATSYQMMPEIAKTAGHIALFQRTPSWCIEVPGYLAPFPPQVNWLDRNFPYLVNFVRLYASWQIRTESLIGTVMIDPDHRDPHSASKANQRMRNQCVDFLTRKLGHRPDLMEKMLPVAPPMTSRPVLVDTNNNIYDTLLRDNVAFVTDPISRITPTGIRTSDGKDHAADVLIYATGFKANDYLWPMTVRGRDGKSIEELWAKDGARAYLGTMLPGFPNFFMLYGPNMNPFGIGLGVTDLGEMVTRFALRCIEQVLLGEQRAVDVTTDAYRRYNAELDRREKGRVYVDHRVKNYYTNEFGRSAANNPFDIRLMWKWLRDPSHADSALIKDNDPVIRPYFGADLVA